MEYYCLYTIDFYIHLVLFEFLNFLLKNSILHNAASHQTLINIYCQYKNQTALNNYLNIYNYQRFFDILIQSVGAHLCVRPIRS